MFKMNKDRALAVSIVVTIIMLAGVAASTFIYRGARETTKTTIDGIEQSFDIIDETTPHEPSTPAPVPTPKPENCTYTVMFQSTSGNTLGSTTVNGVLGSSTSVQYPDYPGYTPVDSAVITFDIPGQKTIILKYNINEYTIQYDLGGGLVSPANPTKYTIETPTIVLNEPELTGHEFIGWTGTVGNTPQLGLSITQGSIGNRTYIANYDKQDYTRKIIFKTKSGIKLGEKSVTKPYNTEETYTPESFNGYVTPSAMAIRWNTTADVTFTYEPISYSISYILNGGTVSTANKTSYNIETAAFSLNNPTKAGYTFKGWTGSNGSTAQTSVSITKGSTGNKSYTANWTANAITVTFHKNDGTTSTVSQTFSYGASGNKFGYNTDGTPKWAQTGQFGQWDRTGHTMLGWSLDSTATAKTWDTYSGVSDNWINTYYPSVDLYAVWKANYYTVTFDANGGTGTTADQGFTYGVAQNLRPNGFSRTGYTFNGWNTKADGSGTAYADKASVSNLAANYRETVTLYAQWKVNSYAVTLNKGTGISAVSGTGNYNYGASVTAKATVSTGYTFKNWTNSSGTAVSTSATYTFTMGTAAQALTANATENTYTIAFNANGGSGTMSSLTSVKYTASKTLTANAFTYTGRTFKGWNTKSDGSGTSYADKASVSKLAATNGATVTLYAQWGLNSYTIKFDANGGSGSMSNMSMTYGTAKNLTANAFTRSGYTFLGWSTSKTATSATYTNKQSVNNLTATSGSTVTLYAVWKSTEVVVFDGTKLASGYTLVTDGANADVVGLFYAKSRFNDVGYHDEGAWAYVAIDVTNYSKITVTYSAVHSSYSMVQIGLCNYPGNPGSNFYTDDIRDESVWNIYNSDVNTSPQSGTVSKDITSLTGVKYLGVATYNTQGNQTDAIITRVVLIP